MRLVTLLLFLNLVKILKSRLMVKLLKPYPLVIQSQAQEVPNLVPQTLSLRAHLPLWGGWGNTLKHTGLSCIAATMQRINGRARLSRS